MKHYTLAGALLLLLSVFGIVGVLAQAEDTGGDPPIQINDPMVTHFSVTETGTLNNYAASWEVLYTDTAVLEVHLPGDPSGEPMLVIDELPLSGSQVVTVPFHTPDSGVRFVLWGVNRVENPPSPQERYEYLASQTVEIAPFATPTSSPEPASPTPSATQPSPTPSATLPSLTPSPTHTQAPGGDLFNVPATYQRFDHGFMIWRSDNGFIWAFADDGRLFGVPLANYGNLPLPDARVILPPPGKFLPVMGFGRVWANTPTIQSALGWPVTGESSFLLGLGFNWERDTQLLRLPDQRWVELLNQHSWRFVGNPGPIPPPTQPPPTATAIPGQVVTGATYQPFSNGFMIWRADTGHILVFYGTVSGNMSDFSVQTYGPLPDNPYPGSPPPGWIKPIFGFGKVWGNFPGVRNGLGWAGGSELGYTLTMKFLPGGNLGTLDAEFNLPDGRRVLTDSGTWRFVS